MSVRIIILCFLLFNLVYKLALEHLEETQYAKPLPACVADVYDANKYATFRAYKAANKRFSHVRTVAAVALDLFVLCSPYFAWVERLAGASPYTLAFFTYLFYWLVSTALSVAFDHHDTFAIEAAFDLNHKTPREFAKDTVLDIVQSFVISFGVLMFITWVVVSLPAWTHGFAITWRGALIFAVIAVAAVIAIVILASLLQILVLTGQYTFTPLEDGALRDAIIALQTGVKRPVTRIYIYNESAKSPRKNAFMFKFLWLKAFGIADNFLTGNDERELLAVLSHEIGHLKHKKNWLNYLNYFAIVAVLFLLIWLMLHPGALGATAAAVDSAFGVTRLNVALYIMLLGVVLPPIGILIGAWQNFRSRREEREADQEAVNNGYGAELITTFKRLSRDELVDVNPHPFVEAMTYTHPGMAARIGAIETAMIAAETKKAPVENDEALRKSILEKPNKYH